MGGYQQLVRGDVFRGKFRNSPERPEPFVPDQPTVVKFTMPDICHVFRPGHRLMVQVQSSWFPLIDRNPQTFVDIYSAGPEAFVTMLPEGSTPQETSCDAAVPRVPSSSSCGSAAAMQPEIIRVSANAEVDR